MMQIEVYKPTHGQPLPPVEWNYEAVKKWVQDGLEAYKGRVYTEDTIAEAKRDRANLNKLAEAIDTKRKEMKSMYLAPYEKFEGEAKEIHAMIKAQAAEIDAQVKTYDKARKEEKLEKIKAELYAPMIGNLAGLVPYEALHEAKWLNVSSSMSAVSSELAAKIDRIIVGMAAIDKLELPQDVADQVKGVFLKRFDLAAAIAEKDRIMENREKLARYEAAQAAVQSTLDGDGKYTPAEAEKPPQARETDSLTAEEVHTESADEVHTMELDFRVWVNRHQMLALREFLVRSGIKYGRVPKESEV